MRPQLDSAIHSFSQYLNDAYYEQVKFGLTVIEKFYFFLAPECNFFQKQAYVVLFNLNNKKERRSQNDSINITLKESEFVPQITHNSRNPHCRHCWNFSKYF